MYRENISSLVVVIPCYKAKDQINIVVSKLISIGITKIIVVDDKCPDQSYKSIEDNNDVHIINLEKNKGVGGAFIEGFNYAYQKFSSSEFKFVAKIDADDQHRTSDLLLMLDDILRKDADYIKGNRYLLAREPVGQSFMRKFGNFGLTFLHKLSTGYWHTGDPINGMILIRANVMKLMITRYNINSRYLFESSLLSSCSKIGGVVYDCPNVIKYDDEHSSLSIRTELFRFGYFYVKNFILRILREYFYPTFNIGSIGIVISLIFLPFSFIYGSMNYYTGIDTNQPTEVGTIAIIMMSFFLGIVGLFFFLIIDSNSRKGSYSIYKYIKDRDLK